MKKKTRMAAVAVILVATIGFVAFAMLNLFVDPYLSVDEVVEHPESYMHRTIQVKGNYQNGSLHTTIDNVTLVMQGENHTLTVLILGETPNLIDGQEIVAVGTLQDGNVIHASEVLTSCPSRYEATTTP
ncbi:MAG: cytochrome c maturation protein CcmE [Candidatus Thorarchaeota archaeon]